jgi:dienelactone hydrolase
MLTTLALLVAAATPAAPGCAAATTFTGTICTPATAGKHPAILLLGGSEGGDTMKRIAPRFVRDGYVAVSVAYFKEPGLPQSLENVPVETIGKALDDIANRPDVDPNRIAILGGSKGGEFALLAASVYPQIHAVVADVPSPFAWEGIPNGPVDPPASSWSYQGKPLPYVSYATEMGAQFQNAYMQHAPLHLRVGYDGAMQENAGQIPAAMFHLENIHGPVLLLAGDDDQLWDSPAQCRLAIDYLHAHHHPYADQYVHYPNAGHLFLFSPQTQVPMGPFTMLLGGSAQGNLAAQAQAWPAIGSFLGRALGQ